MSTSPRRLGDEAAVVVDGLDHRFGELRALRDITLGVPRGSVCGLIGPNGAGKTTLLRILAGELAPQEGRVSVLGCELPRDVDRLRSRLGYMPDSAGLYPELTLREYLVFFARLHGRAPSGTAAVVDATLQLAGMEHLAERSLDGLSKGEKQRVLLGRALIHDPELLILDEPADGLDPEGRLELRELLGLLAERGKTVVVSSHVLADLELACTHVAFVAHGRLLYAGTRNDLLSGANERCRARIDTLDPVQALVDWLAGRPGVSVLEAGPRTLELEIPGAPEQAHELLTAMMRESVVRIVSFSRRAETLESAYLRLLDEADA